MSGTLSEPARSTDADEYSQTESDAPAFLFTYRRLRLFYFVMASVWGFVVGVASLKVMLLLGGSAELQVGWILTLVPFAGFAIVGGAVTSVLYRQARRRLRR